jgi:hypothetical protein
LRLTRVRPVGWVEKRSDEAQHIQTTDRV